MFIMNNKNFNHKEKNNEQGKVNFRKATDNIFKTSALTLVTL